MIQFQDIIEQSNIFKDKRLEKRGTSILNFIVRESRVVMQKTDKWNDQISFYRFFSNDNVTEENLIECMKNHCVSNCLDKNHLLLFEDTTELNMEKHRNRIASKEKIGLTGNNSDLGFFGHPTLVADPRDSSLVALLIFICGIVMRTN